MVINSCIEWWEAASLVIPDLPTYATQFGLKFDQIVAIANFNNKDHKKLYHQFFDLWESLPDIPEIREDIFFKLCELCSEHWVFEKEDMND